MNRIALALTVLLLPAAARGQDALTIARDITTKGATLFDTKDAAAMAATYVEDAEIVAEIRNEQNGERKTERYRGRTQIRNLYMDLFNGDQDISSENQVDYARLVAPDRLVIVGTFRMTADANSHTIDFVQIREKQGQEWKISSLRLFVALP